MSSKYESPYPFPYKKEVVLEKEFHDIGVGRSQESM